MKVLMCMPNSVEQSKEKTMQIYGENVESWDQFQDYCFLNFGRVVTADTHISNQTIKYCGVVTAKMNLEGVHLIPLKHKIREEEKEGRIRILGEVK